MSVWAGLARALSAVEERPRVGAGLETARDPTRSGRDYVVVHNPCARTYARLDAREFELLELIDGQQALEADDFRDVLAGYLGRGSALHRLSHLRLRAQN